MPVLKSAVVKKVAGLVRRALRPSQKRKAPSAAVPDEKSFGVIFAGNATTARKNLDRFAPRI